MKVVITEAALTDLVGIGQYIGRDNPARAESFVNELYASCAGLGEMPEAFPLMLNREEQGIRRRRHGNYLIFFRIGAEAVEVLHVLHGARDYEAVLLPGEE